jgi:hypothetical protein
VRDLQQTSALRAAAAVLFAVVTATAFAISDPAQAVAVLFVVPIALLALTDGRRGGLAGALVAAGLLVVWVVADDAVELTVLGWASRLLAFFLIGGLVGHFEQRAREAQRRLLDERYVAELHDRVVQALVVAHYRLGDDHPAADSVSAALEGARDIVSRRLGEVAPGDLRLHEGADGPPGEDRSGPQA